MAVNTNSLKKMLKGNTMIFILLAVMLFFQALIVGFGKGSLFAPENITNLINQTGQTHVKTLSDKITESVKF